MAKHFSEHLIADRDIRENALRIRLTDEERKTLDDAAAMKALDTSTWARSELVALARKIAKNEDGLGE